MNSLIISICLLAFSCSPFTNTQSNLTVEVKGIMKVKGNLYLALFNSEESYINNNAFAWKMIKVENNTTIIKFDKLKNGVYVVSAFHDENSNGKLDTKIFGIPKEKYGFSNNPPKMKRRANFDECKFEIKKNSSIEINLI